MTVRSFWPLLIAACASVASAQNSQTTAAPLKPLEAIPYTPSLDVNSLDRSVDPCVDFYKYACGSWIKSNPIPADQSSWDVYAKLTNDNIQFLWGILEEDARLTTRTAVQQKIGDYYAACMNTEAIERLGLKPLEPELDRIAAIESRPELAAYLREDAAAHGAYFFQAQASQDPKNAEMMIIDLGAGGLGLPDRDYYTNTDAKSEEIRKRYVEYLTKLQVLAGTPQEKATALAGATMKIETALATASLTRVEMRDPYKLYHSMKLEAIERLAPAIEVGAFLRAQDVPSASFSNILVEQPEFMKALQVQLADEPLEALKAYLRIHALNRAAGNLSSGFEDARFDFYDNYLRGVPQMQPRWKRCVRQVNEKLGDALGQEFVARTFSADTKAKVLKMTDQIEAAMQQEIEQLNWMSEPTKKQAILKLHAVRDKIGYPDKWRDYSTLRIGADGYFGNVTRANVFEAKRDWAKVGKPVDRGEWSMTAPTVDAYYNPQMNDINFPAGVLQPPLYDLKEDDAPNYGDTGATIGHELTHGFDDEGRQFDAQGNLKDWWTAADANGFEDRVNCQREQYAKYVVVDEVHINSKLTSGEDTADLGGTMLAYLAWKKQTEGMTLQPKDGLAPEQRFFVGNAQWACGSIRPEQAREYALTDPHSPLYARVNGIFSNMPQFATAFGCKAGQPMVKAPICRVW